MSPLLFSSLLSSPLFSPPLPYFLLLSSLLEPPPSFPSLPSSLDDQPHPPTYLHERPICRLLTIQCSHTSGRITYTRSLAPRSQGTRVCVYVYVCVCVCVCVCVLHGCTWSSSSRTSPSSPASHHRHIVTSTYLYLHITS